MSDNTTEEKEPQAQVGGTHYSDKKIQPIDFIDAKLLERLVLLGLIPTKERDIHIGESNYSTKTIQPWSIWLDYPELTSWDHDIIKRVLRTKKSDQRELDYKKIIHICQERLRQLEVSEEAQKMEATIYENKQYITIVDSDDGQKDFCIYTTLSKDAVDEAITANKQTEDHDYESLFELLRIFDKDLEVIDLSKIMVSY